jgi:hypothetical protein
MSPDYIAVELEFVAYLRRGEAQAWEKEDLETLEWQKEDIVSFPTLRE